MPNDAVEISNEQYAVLMEGEAQGKIISADVSGNPLLIDRSTTPPVYSCSPWQIRKALNAAGLRAQTESAVAGSSDQDLKDGWEFASEFRSDDPFVIAMGAALGKSQAETVAIIQAASAL